MRRDMLQAPAAYLDPRYWLPNRRKWLRRNVEGPSEGVARRRYRLQEFARIAILDRPAYPGAEL
jgi:hypothetical protein